MRIKLYLFFILAAAALCARAEARDADFDGGAVKDFVDYTLDASYDVDGQAAPVSPDGSVIYAKGFIKKDLPSAAWKSFKDAKVQIPDKLDLRPGLTQVENQGFCGSCWAFSLTATHRDGHALGDGDPGRLSQEWLVEHSTYALGCKGGYFDSANDFIAPRGQPLYSACPYKQGHGKCAADLPAAARIKAWYMLGEKGQPPTVRDIEAYMTLSGKPISIAVAAAQGGWQSYRGGIYSKCRYGELDHMINIVGWDNEGAQFDESGNLPPGKGVWILRNSWGASWGEKGYMRSKMTDPAGKRCNAVAEEAAFFEF